MQKFILPLLILLKVNACHDSAKPFYKKINPEVYNSHTSVDTIYSTQKYIATKVQYSTVFFKDELILIKKTNAGQLSYFSLDPDAYFENDSTIIVYAPPFKSTSQEGAFFKNGIWVYTEFVEHVKNREGVRQSGANFNVDSVPPNIASIKIPKEEGIYIVKKDSLCKISNEQSEDNFLSLKENGFYFIPNSGRLFERHSVDEIK
jgi:hypothetical protein